MSEPRTDFETVAASQTTQALGPVGNVGDIVERIIIIPAAAAAGTVKIRDGTAGSDITLFAGGGTTALQDLKPLVVHIGARSLAAGGWQVSTGANVSVLAVGRFT